MPFATAPEDTIRLIESPFVICAPVVALSVDCLKSVIVSLVLPEESVIVSYLKISFPAPPVRLSAPASPSIVSTPSPPSIVSFPPLPLIPSTPAPPLTTSLPVPPASVSLPELPVIESLPDPPVKVSPVVVPPPLIVSSPAEPISWSEAVPPVIVKSIPIVSRLLLTLNVAEPTFLAERSIVIVPAFNAAVLCGAI